jgi:hypothetical protein
MEGIADTYGIIKSEDLTKIDFSQIIESNGNTVRKSLDLSKFVIKWNSENVPSFITNGTVIPLQILNQLECIDLMQTPEWSEPTPPPFN